MPRPTLQNSFLPLPLVLLLAAAPAWAAVTLTGDVRPSSPGGFDTPFGQPGIDDDGDEVRDWIDGNGNVVDAFLADSSNVNGGNGLAWLNTLIWRDYDTAQNILVGETGYGQIVINNQSALRYQHLVLGGASDLNDGDLDLTTVDSENFDFLQDLQSNQVSRSGYGVMTVSGAGSVFNNDPNIIPAEFQTAINFALGVAPSTLITDLEAVPFIPGTIAGNLIPATIRESRGAANETYDVHVGLLGGGELNVLNGGRVEIQDALQVATASTAQGTVTVDGLGSYLGAYGRSEFRDTGANPSTPTTEFASYVGGNGRGQMTISGGGRADFFNGLSIGAANGGTTLDEGGIDPDPFSSGTVTVTGFGSTMTVYPTFVTAGTAGDDLGNDADFAVGELRDLTSGDGMDNLRYEIDGSVVNAPDGTTNLGEGMLRIEAGGRVNLTTVGTDSTPGRGADLGVGFNGVVQMRTGTLSVTGDIVNDGRIDGDGSISGQTLDTTVYSVIRGGDPEAQPGNPSTAPLRITLAGEGASSLGDTNQGTFTNRGLVQGLVELRITGDIDNRGTIEIGGEITGRTLTTTVDSRLVGDLSTGRELRIRLDGANQVNSIGPNAPVAFKNRGALEGAIDVITPGGFVNGDDQQFLGATPNGNGGVISASGTIQSGTFVNYGHGKITVAAGESLSILATGSEPELDNSLFTALTAVTVPTVLEDGINPAAADGEIDTSAPALFFQANLGDIQVNGGSLELGRLTDRVPDRAQANLHANFFRNARFVVVDGSSTTLNPVGEETIGTITANDGTVRFRDGVYNTGVMAFTGGDNLVGGRVLNVGSEVLVDDDGNIATPPISVGRGIDYDPAGGEAYVRPGVIVVSGDGTTVTFEDTVTNGGVISIGPGGNVVNFLGDFENAGTVEIAISGLTSDPESAYITVAGGVTINGGPFVLNPIGPSFAFAAGFSAEVISADSLSEESLFTELELPTLEDGLFWEMVYDVDAGEVRAEVIESLAMGADFTGDGIVSQDDVDVWIRNVGIESGASVIQGDVDLDGDVDLADYDELMAQLLTGVPVQVGSASGSATVPEPTTLLLLALAGAGVLARRV